MAVQSGEVTQALENQLHRHGPLVDALAQRLGLPLHIVFLEEFARSARRFQDVARRTGVPTLVAFAVKCNPCRGAVRAASRLGLGADVVSEHELRTALEEGIDPAHIVCNGNAKSDIYLQRIIDSGAHLAVDGLEELQLVDSMGRSRGVPVPVLLRVSGLDVAGYTASTQTTAQHWSKFGFSAAELPELLATLPDWGGVRFDGFSAHVGTQLCDPIAYLLLLDAFAALSQRAAALGTPPRLLDLGGGWPVNFLSEEGWQALVKRLHRQVTADSPVAEWVTWDGHPMGASRQGMATYAGPTPWTGKAYWAPHPGAAMLDHVLAAPLSSGGTFREALASLGSPMLIVEPGRSLMATAGVTLAEAMTTKPVMGHSVVALDLGINNHGTNLLAPDVFPAAVLPPRPDDAPVEAFLAGRLCFGGDMITTAKVTLNRLPRRGDRLAIFFTGAYSADHFASHSCGFPLPAKVAVDREGNWELWRGKGTYDDVFPPL